MNTAISFLVDDDPRFLMQAWNLILALRRTGDFPADGVELYLHHTRGIDSERLALFRKLGARTIAVEPFGQGPAAYCNKLRQLETPALRDADRVILLDADVLPLKRLIDIDPGEGVAGKIVDFINPEEEALAELMKGVPGEWQALVTAEPSFSPGRPTIAANCNGGFYVLSRKALAALTEAWPRWSRYCLDRADLLGSKAIHSDQLGFAFAVAECGLSWRALPLTDNFPTHVGKKLMERETPAEIRLIHYHGELDNHGLPKSPGVDWVDRQIAPAVADLREARREMFDNRIFWDFRYRTTPDLGSGVGSRGQVLDYKRSILEPILKEAAERQVLDVGCGDLETFVTFGLTKYLGIDLSEQALSIARSKRPDWSFATTPLSSIPDNFAALSVCLDVLIHQKSAESYDQVINDLVRATTDVVIVTGYDRLPTFGGIVFYHGALGDRLRAHPDVQEVVTLGGYHEAVMLAAILKPGGGTAGETALVQAVRGSVRAPLGENAKVRRAGVLHRVAVRLRGILKGTANRP